MSGAKNKVKAPRADAEPVVRLEGVTRILPVEPSPVTLVENIDLEIYAGDFMAITGPSGSGKSSLIYLIGLLDEPTEGRVFVEGHDTRADRSRLARTRLEKMGFVFQFHFLLPEFTALQNVMLPMQKLARLTGDEMHERALQLLAYFGLAEAVDKHPGQLSGGMRQRVAIARALANDPAVIIADEPTGNLDTTNSVLVFEMFEKLARDQGRAVVSVTHDLDLAARAWRQVRIVDGKLV